MAHLVENAQHVANEKNDQYGAQSDTSAAAIAPTTVTIVPAAAPRTNNKITSNISIVNFLSLEH